MGLRIWTSGFGFLDSFLWLWASRFECIGLSVRICISGFGSQDLDFWVWFSGFGFLVWVSKFVTGFGKTNHFTQNHKIELLVLHDWLVFGEQNGN